MRARLSQRKLYIDPDTATRRVHVCTHIHTYTHSPMATSQTSPCYHAELFHQILLSFTWHLIHVLYQDSSHSVLVCMFCWPYLIICNCSLTIRARPWSSYNTLNASAGFIYLFFLNQRNRP